jgi:uncharacterized protein YndB with AHSA1/START domain
MIHEEYGTATGPGTVRIERYLPGPVERIWAYLTESEKRRKWLAAGEMELRVGGSVEHRFVHSELSAEKHPSAKYEGFEEGHTIFGTVLRCDPPRVLSYTWGHGAEDSEVTFELEPRGDEVLLIVTHRRLRSHAEMSSVAGGWHTHLGLLIDHLQGRPPRGFWSSHAAVEAEYARRLAGAAPAGAR